MVTAAAIVVLGAVEAGAKVVTTSSVVGRVIVVNALVVTCDSVVTGVVVGPSPSEITKCKNVYLLETRF